MEKELKINVPEGYEIDKENSTFERIRFKKKEEPKQWRDGFPKEITGYYISDNAYITYSNCYSYDQNRNVFNTFHQANSALAMAQISQIIANDKRFGGPITDEEWKDTSMPKYSIERMYDIIHTCTACGVYHFLSFHTEEQRDLFLKENEDLVMDYLML